MVYLRTAILAAAAVFLIAASGGAYGATTASAHSHRHFKDPAVFVTSLTSPTGLVAVGTGVYIEDAFGNLFHWGSTHGLTLVATPPKGDSTSGYTSMAAGTVGGLFTIYLTNNVGEGLYACASPTISGCGSLSQFISPDSTFCALMIVPCDPYGLSFYKGNLFYVDPDNHVEVELFGATGFTSAKVYHTFLASERPIGLFIDSTGNHWVAGDTCSGNIYKNGVKIKSVGDSVESIAISTSNPSKTHHVYVGDTGSCHSTAGHILDVTDGKSLPTFPGAGPFDLFGITPNFYFTDVDNGNVYKTTDTA